LDALGAFSQTLFCQLTESQTEMKRKLSLFMSLIIASAGIASAGDATALWNQHCASCHGKDGSGSTMMGKKLGVKDYRDAKVQAAFSDGEAERAIKEGVKTNGKQTMKPFGEKLSDADVKALVAYIRSLKK
jgi:mono/diheme cytochrome c family protein